MLQSFMHTWNIKDYCTLFLQVFFLSKISEEMYMALEKHSFNLHKKNKRRRKKITTNTKKFSQVLNCNYKKLFPSACQLDNLSLLFGKFCAWFCLIGFFFQFLMMWLNVGYNLRNICWSGVPLSDVTWDTSCIAAVSCFQCHIDQASLLSSHAQLLLAGDKIPLLPTNQWLVLLVRAFSSCALQTVVLQHITKDRVPFEFCPSSGAPYERKRNGSSLAHISLYLCL